MTVTFQVGDREFGGSGNLEIDFWVGLRGVLMVPLVRRVSVESSAQGGGAEHWRTGRHVPEYE